MVKLGLGKFILTAGQFAWCTVRNETPADFILLYLAACRFSGREVWWPHG